MQGLAQRRADGGRRFEEVAELRAGRGAVRRLADVAGAQPRRKIAVRTGKFDRDRLLRRKATRSRPGDK